MVNKHPARLSADSTSLASVDPNDLNSLPIVSEIQNVIQTACDGMSFEERPSDASGFRPFIASEETALAREAAAIMRATEHSFQEFTDAIQTADDEIAFERVATRLTERLGFRWFAYLRVTEHAPILISSYPKSWTRRFEHGYQQLDPVLDRARREHDLFSWGGNAPKAAGTLKQRRFFDEAMTFGIKSGLTVPIRSGFGEMAAFTLATDDRTMRPEQLFAGSKNIIQLAGLYFHTHLTVRLKTRSAPPPNTEIILTQRERQCLAWTARGKTVADAAVLIGIAPRTVTFHLEKARRKFGAASIAQCIAEALRRGLLP